MQLAFQFFLRHCTTIVQSVSSRLCACIYEARRRLFHTLFNTYVEKLIRLSQSLVPKLISPFSKGRCPLEMPFATMSFAICARILTP